MHQPRPSEIAMLVLETDNGKLEYPDITDAFFASVAEKVRRHTRSFVPH